MLESEGAKLLELDRIQGFLNSDASLDVLLTRLKQSITTGEELGKYVKKKALIEDDHYGQLKKFAGHTRTNLKTSLSKLKNDGFSAKLDAIIDYDEKLHLVGLSYVKALNVIYDEVTSLVATISRSRKTIKDDSKRREKECVDAIGAAEKAKQKYYHLCDDLEKLKGLDPNKKLFLKSKSVEQQEDDLQRKVDLANQDYKLKVLVCKKLKDEMLMIHRPTTLKQLKNLILETDIALNVQLQKFTTYSENLVMNSGILIAPLQPNKPSMKLLASSIDNEMDLYKYLVKFEKSPTNKQLIPVDYQVHPSLAKFEKTPSKPFLNKNTGTAAPASTIAPSAIATTAHLTTTRTGGLSESTSSDKAMTVALPDPSFQDANSAFTYSLLDPATAHALELNGPKSLNLQLAPLAQPTFGVSVEEVIQFAGIDNVPLVVKKCIEVVESYGLDIEGIYRTSGNKTTVQHLRESIDTKFTNYLVIGNNIDPSNVLDADIYCVALLLKIYFASLPEPLLTTELYQLFIETVKSLDESYIVKKLHHLVFNLPDGAYFTLRALIFHLNKVAANQHLNRMSAKLLAIIWGPAILNDNSMSPQDLSYKSKVVEELMLIANEIFDTDE